MPAPPTRTSEAPQSILCSVMESATWTPVWSSAASRADVVHAHPPIPRLVPDSALCPFADVVTVCLRLVMCSPVTIADEYAAAVSAVGVSAQLCSTCLACLGSCSATYDW